MPVQAYRLRLKRTFLAPLSVLELFSERLA